MTDTKGNVYQQPYQQGDIHEFTGTYGREVFMRLPVPMNVGEVTTFKIKVEYLGEKAYKQTYAQRVKALAQQRSAPRSTQKQREIDEKERQEKELIQRRKRIMNQIELAFVKQGKDAVNFVTCDKCSARATHLGLAMKIPEAR